MSDLYLYEDCPVLKNKYDAKYIERINAELIRQGIPQGERLLRLKISAQQMMKSLLGDSRIGGTSISASEQLNRTSLAAPEYPALFFYSPGPFTGLRWTALREGGLL